MMNHPSQQVELTLGLRAAKLVRRSLAMEALSSSSIEDRQQLKRIVLELDEKIRQADVRWVRVEVLSVQSTGGSTDNGR
jgi:hypothetical protein